MRFDARLVSGRFERRYKRFFVDVRRRGGEVVTAHCANPGSMRGCHLDGGKVWLSPATDPARRLRWTWQLAEHDDALVVVNTALANRVVAEALEAGVVAEARGAGPVRREVAVGASRIDFRVGPDDAPLWIEVKASSMSMGRGVAAFPDSVSQRAARHAGELATLARRGERAMLLFCVPRGDITVVRPADEIDPAYGAALRAAAKAGVEVVAYRCAVSTTEVRLDRRIDVDLSPR